MRCVLAFFVAHLGLLAVVAAAPQVLIPLSAQLPPVARVGEKFVFTLLPGSFSNATLQANTLPAWLQFSAANPTFYGTPAANDVGETQVYITATDSTGSTNSSFTLIVSRNAAPIVNMPFEAQLADPSKADIASAKVTPGGHGVTINPYWSFSLGWNGETFKRASSNSNGNLYYQAHLRGETGLPTWLEWSNTTFTFNGVAPGNGTYDVVVTATDYWNHTAATSSFVLSVGDGAALENSLTWDGIKTVARNRVSYALDLSGMLLNGKKVDAADIDASPDLSALSWLSYDKNTRTISGTTPDTLTNGTAAAYNIPVTLSSTNSSNTLSYVSAVNVSVLPYAFTSFRLPTTNVSAGSTFNFPISQYLVNASSPASINATVVPADAAEWLLYYPDNYTLVGMPPANLTYSTIDVSFMSTTEGATSAANVSMPINGIMGPSGDGDAAPIPNASSHGGLSKTKKIIIGCVVGLGVPLILLALLLLCCCLKRRAHSRSAAKSEASWDAGKEGTPETLVATPGKAKSRSQTPLESPQRRFGVRGLFGTVNEPSLPTTSSKESSFHDAESHDSFVGSGELIGVKDPAKNSAKAGPTLPTQESHGSLASWESEASMHWSGENEYLEPLYERVSFDALTPTPGASPNPQASIGTPTFGAATLPSSTGSPSTMSPSSSGPPRPTTAGSHYVAGPAGDVPRPRAGFNPSYPRWVNKGDKVPALSSDNVSLYFSEFDQEGTSSSNMVPSRPSLAASRSLDSFAGVGSELVGTSSSRLSNSLSNGASAAGSWWKSTRSNLSFGRYGSGSGSGSYGSSDAVVATAQRQSLDTQRSSLLPNEVIDFTAGPSASSYRDDISEREPTLGGNSPAISAVTPTTPTERPVSYLVVPAYVGQSYTPPKATPNRRHSSSRRHGAATSTREHIMRGDAPSEVLYSAPLDSHSHAR